MGEGATLASVWTDASTAITSGVSAGIGLVMDYPILIAPAVLGIAGIIIGMAKGLFKTRKRK